jgi:hypothetical protein
MPNRNSGTGAHARGARNSERPRAARRRLKQNVDRLDEAIRADIALVYKKPVEEWDWDELSHGRPRGDNGKFTGPKPSWITPAVTAEAKRRMRSMTEDQIMVYADGAIKVLGEIMNDDSCDDFGKPNTPASVKLQAAQYILNQIIGTPTARVQIEEYNPLAELMGGILVNPDGNPSHVIVEGQVVAEEAFNDDSET